MVDWLGLVWSCDNDRVSDIPAVAPLDRRAEPVTSSARQTSDGGLGALDHRKLGTAATLELRRLVVAVPPKGRRVTVDAIIHGGLCVLQANPAEATAVARVLGGLAPPVAGSVLINRREVTDRTPAERHIAVVPAGGALLPHLTIGQNFRYGRRGRHSVTAIARVHEQRLIDQLELAPIIDLLPHEVSARQRLRAALGRAALCLPETMVWVLPDAAVTGERLRRTLDRIARPELPALTTLVCSADPVALAQADEVVACRAAG